MSPESDPIPGLFRQIREAARRLAGQSHRTPVVTSRTLDSRAGSAVFLKCENLQRTGAFKFRGAFNAVSRLGQQQREAGVVTHSSGNHAQALALVGRLLEVPTTVVMPDNAPRAKRAATEGYGARVVEYDPNTADRETLSKELAERHHLTLIPPFDHPDVIAGQGTTFLELWEQAGPLDALLLPCGGGGLLSGCAVAARNLSPDCRVIGIEPRVADDATRSFYSGRLQKVHNPPTIADGTRVSSLGRLTFPLIRSHVDEMRTVTEEAIEEAVRFLLFRLKVLVEPSGALGVAALLSGAVEPGERTGVVLSGGNIDPATLVQILGGGA
jgi:threonine dehydratase